jgi:hypothetical protein
MHPAVVESGRETTPVVVLFPPRLVPLVDVFRGLGPLGDTYDVTALDALERRLGAIVGERAAKGVVSDALLLAFGLRRDRIAPLTYGPLASRTGTLDEYRLLALVAAAYWRDFHLASKAAAALEMLHTQPLVALALDVARRLERAGIALALPDARLLKPARQVERRVDVVVSPAEPLVTEHRNC